MLFMVVGYMPLIFKKLCRSLGLRNGCGLFKNLFVFFADMDDRKNIKEYWRTNLRYLLILLTIWFIVSYGFGILLVDQLNTIKLGGFKLGFWFAQQGSIFTFVILIFVYVRLMNKLDKKYDVDEE